MRVLFNPCKFKVPCETWGCYNRAKYSIGRPDGPSSLNHNLCERCAKSAVANIPPELLPEQEAAPETPEQEESPVACDECGREFKTAHAAKVHKSIAHKGVAV